MPVLLAMTAAASWGTGDFLGGVASRRGGRVNAVTMVIQLAGFATFVPVALWTGGRLTLADLVWSSIAGIGSGLALYQLYIGFTKSHTGVVSPIAAIGTAGIPVLFGLATGETLSAYQAVGVPLGLVAIWLVSRPNAADTVGDLRSRAGVNYGIGAGVSFAIMFISLDQLSAGSGAWGVLPVRLGGAVTLLVITGFRRLPLVPVASVWLPIVGSGLFGSVGNLAFIVATRLGNLSIVAVVSSLFPAATVILAYLFLRERLSRIQLTGVVAALAAIALVSTG
jgi:drug/metabolite transporter (DMT)-like permease